MDSWYKSKFVDLNNKTTKHVDNIRNVREVIVTAKKDVSNNDHSWHMLKLGNIIINNKILNICSITFIHCFLLF